MSFTSWLRNLRSALAPGQRERKHRRQRSLRAATNRPQVEALEDRCLLSFSPAVSYLAGDDPRAVLTADFNGDGKLDLATINFFNSNVSVFLGNGDGTFQSALASASGANPRSVAVGDFNGDGNLDLATANFATVSLLLGNGDGTFQAPIGIDIGYESQFGHIDPEPASVAVGDFNADGNLDLGVTSNVYVIDGYSLQYESPYGHYEGNANVLLGNGDGSFSAPNTTELGDGRHAYAAVADFSNDGMQDFATTNYDYGTVRVLAGDGGGNLQPPTDFSLGYSPSSLAAGDVNGDGNSDLVAARYYANNVSVLLGDGAGGFGTAQSYAAGTDPASVVLGDFDHDAILDIATANVNSNDVSVLRGMGDGTFLTAVYSAVDGNPDAVAAGDFNGDGWLDVVTASDYFDANASVLINDHSWPPPVAPSVSIHDVTVTEGNTGTVNATFTMSLSAAYGQPVTVHYETANGSAMAGGDYTGASGDVTFAAGQTTRSVTISVLGDRSPEATETFAVNLSAPTNATIADGQGIGTILDDEPRISIGDVTKKEGNGKKTTLFTFTVTLSAAYDQAVTMSFRTVDGTATTSDSDYLAKTGTLTFAPGETTKTLTIEVKGDSKKEADETFYLDLFYSSTNALFTKNRGIGTILNDD